MLTNTSVSTIYSSTATTLQFSCIRVRLIGSFWTLLFAIHCQPGCVSHSPVASMSSCQLLPTTHCHQVFMLLPRVPAVSKLINLCHVCHHSVIVMYMFNMTKSWHHGPPLLMISIIIYNTIVFNQLQIRTHLTLSIPNIVCLNSSLDLLSFTYSVPAVSRTVPHHILLILSNFHNMSPVFIGQVSLPYTIALLTHALHIPYVIRPSYYTFHTCTVDPGQYYVIVLLTQSLCISYVTVILSHALYSPPLCTRDAPHVVSNGDWWSSKPIIQIAELPK